MAHEPGVATARCVGALAAAVAVAVAAATLASCGPPSDRPVSVSASAGTVPFAERPAPPGTDIFGDVVAHIPVEPDLEEVPADARLGETLRFVAVLRNPTDADVPLSPCPTYFMSYGEDGAGVLATGRLHCEAAPAAIPAHGRVAFEMRLHLPPTHGLYPGYPARIFWRLTSSPHGNWTQSAVVPVR